MIKKTITYVDYNGVERTEDFYFHLSKAEIISLEAKTEGGLENWAKNVVETHDNRQLYNFFEELIKMSYGVKSADGRRFMKSEEISKNFTETEAYASMIIEFFNNPDALASFFSQLVGGIEKRTEAPNLNIV